MCFKVVIEYQVEDTKFANEQFKISTFQYVSTLVFIAADWFNLEKPSIFLSSIASLIDQDTQINNAKKCITYALSPIWDHFFAAFKELYKPSLERLKREWKPCLCS